MGHLEVFRRTPAVDERAAPGGDAGEPLVAGEPAEPELRADAPTVHDVYVVGTTYSGSTLLGNALNGHADVFHAGEISRLPAFGIGPHADECMLCRIARRECPVWTPETVAAVQEAAPRETVPALRGATGRRVVVDSSKYVAWLDRCLADGGLGRSIRVLLTLRSPFGFAASVRRTDGRPAWEAGNMWRDTVYDALRLLNRYELPFMVVRYEDLALEPEPVLRRVCDFLSLEWEPDILRFWTRESHALGGNPHAYVWYPDYLGAVDYDNEFAADRDTAEAFGGRTFGGWADERWRDELTSDDLDQLLQTPMLTSMADLSGYNLRALLPRA